MTALGGTPINFYVDTSPTDLTLSFIVGMTAPTGTTSNQTIPVGSCVNTVLDLRPVRRCAPQTDPIEVAGTVASVSTVETAATGSSRTSTPVQFRWIAGPPVIGMTLHNTAPAGTVHVALSEPLVAGESLSVSEHQGSPTGGAFDTLGPTQMVTPTTYAVADPTDVTPALLSSLRATITYETSGPAYGSYVLETSGPPVAHWGTTTGAIAPAVEVAGASTPPSVGINSLTEAVSHPAATTTASTFAATLSQPLVGGETADLCSSSWGELPTGEMNPSGFGCETMRVTGTSLHLWLPTEWATPSAAATFRILITDATGVVMGTSSALPSTWTIPAPVVQAT